MSVALSFGSRETIGGGIGVLCRGRTVVIMETGAVSPETLARLEVKASSYQEAMPSELGIGKLTRWVFGALIGAKH